MSANEIHCCGDNKSTMQLGLLRNSLHVSHSIVLSLHNTSLIVVGFITILDKIIGGARAPSAPMVPKPMLN